MSPSCPPASSWRQGGKKMTGEKINPSTSGWPSNVGKQSDSRSGRKAVARVCLLATSLQQVDLGAVQQAFDNLFGTTSLCEDQDVHVPERTGNIIFSLYSGNEAAAAKELQDGKNRSSGCSQPKWSACPRCASASRRSSLKPRRDGTCSTKTSRPTTSLVASAYQLQAKTQKDAKVRHRRFVTRKQIIRTAPGEETSGDDKKKAADVPASSYSLHGKNKKEESEREQLALGALPKDSANNVITTNQELVEQDVAAQHEDEAHSGQRRATDAISDGSSTVLQAGAAMNRLDELGQFEAPAGERRTDNSHRNNQDGVAASSKIRKNRSEVQHLEGNYERGYDRTTSSATTTTRGDGDKKTIDKEFLQQQEAYARHDVLPSPLVDNNASTFSSLAEVQKLTAQDRKAQIDAEVFLPLDGPQHVEHQASETDAETAEGLSSRDDEQNHNLLQKTEQEILNAKRLNRKQQNRRATTSNKVVLAHGRDEEDGDAAPANNATTVTSTGDFLSQACGEDYELLGGSGPGAGDQLIVRNFILGGPEYVNDTIEPKKLYGYEIRNYTDAQTGAPKEFLAEYWPLPFTGSWDGSSDAAALMTHMRQLNALVAQCRTLCDNAELEQPDREKYHPMYCAGFSMDATRFAQDDGSIHPPKPVEGPFNVTCMLFMTAYNDWPELVSHPAFLTCKNKIAPSLLSTAATACLGMPFPAAVALMIGLGAMLLIMGMMVVCCLCYGSDDATARAAARRSQSQAAASRRSQQASQVGALGVGGIMGVSPSTTGGAAAPGAPPGVGAASTGALPVGAAPPGAAATVGAVGGAITTSNVAATGAAVGAQPSPGAAVEGAGTQPRQRPSFTANRPTGGTNVSNASIGGTALNKSTHVSPVDNAAGGKADGAAEWGDNKDHQNVAEADVEYGPPPPARQTLSQMIIEEQAKHGAGNSSPDESEDEDAAHKDGAAHKPKASGKKKAKAKADAKHKPKKKAGAGAHTKDEPEESDGKATTKKKGGANSSLKKKGKDQDDDDKPSGGTNPDRPSFVGTPGQPVSFS
ncbi:unnamed protein product [Amoebophrya sp. A120]|nr:unnamed protein product [Amoebophrya sp. A120]|eukprot:GSA120T00006063001.1